jgi:flagellar biosynthesis/type III secretory pathway protein FliH
MKIIIRNKKQIKKGDYDIGYKRGYQKGYRAGQKKHTLGLEKLTEILVEDLKQEHRA